VGWKSPKAGRKESSRPVREGEGGEVEVGKGGEGVMAPADREKDWRGDL